MKFRYATSGLALLFCTIAATVPAHVDWTRVNDLAADTIGLYHFGPGAYLPGDVLAVPSCLPPGRGLRVGTPAGAGAQASVDLVEPIFAPASLRVNSAQTFISDDTVPGLDGDLTIEFWFKWDVTLANATLDVGLSSGAKLRLTRDTATPANDQFGIQGTHGDFRSAPDFPNWPAIGPDEGQLGEWAHVAMTIHSTGQEFNVGLNHDVYSAGSVARFFFNGHLVGGAPHTLDISGLQVHAGSRLLVSVSSGGSILVDEVTIWARDWSQNGAVSGPFANGRGPGMICPSPTPSPAATSSPVPTLTPTALPPTSTPTAAPTVTGTPTPPPATATPTAGPCCPGDADNSGGFVDANDFISVQANFGADREVGGLGDADCSGSFVDANDFIAVQADFGADCM